MGTLTLPTNGSVYVDANAIIYRVEAVQLYLMLPSRFGMHLMREHRQL